MQVWDAITGNKLYTFEGHEAPVYSVCPHQKENIQVFIFFLKIFICIVAIVNSFPGLKHFLEIHPRLISCALPEF